MQRLRDNGPKCRCFLSKKAAAQHGGRCNKMGRQLGVIEHKSVNDFKHN